MLEFALIYAHGLLASASIGIISFYYAQICAEYALGPVAGTVIISMFSLGGAIGGVFAGVYLVRTHLHRTLCAGSALLALSSLGSMVLRGGAAFFALRVFASFAFIVVVTVIPSIFARYDDGRRVVGLALWGAYLPLGIALGNGLSALVLRGWDVSWRATLAMHGMVLAAATAALAARAHRGDVERGHHDEVPVGSLRPRLRRLGRASFAYAAGFGTFTAVFLITAGILPRTLVEIGGLSPSNAGIAASFVLAFSTLGSFAVLYLVPRIRSAQLLFGIGFAGSALASFGLYAMARGPNAVACSAVAIIVISGLIPAAVFAYVPRIVDHHEDVGTLNGLLTQFGCIGSLVGPPLLGWWIQRFSYSTGWIPFTALCAVGFSLFMPSLQKMSLRHT